MKNVVILYEQCCIYEIVNTCYYLSCANADISFVGLRKGTIQSMEGFPLNVRNTLDEVAPVEVRSLIIPGGNSKVLMTDNVREVIRSVHSSGRLVAAICSAVDVLDEAGILDGIRSTHSVGESCVRDGNVITARANAYVDFGIEIAKALDLFADEQDLRETIDFWKYFKRMD